MQAPFPLFRALNVPYRIIELLHTNRHKELLRVRWSNPFLEAIYEINLKIALLQLNTSQYLSRIEGSPPKRGVGGSNPLMDASEQRRKPLFSRVFGFSYIKSYEKALSLYEIKFYSKI